MTAAIVRLGPSDVALAVETFAMMGRVFEEPTEKVDTDYVSKLLVRDDFWALAATDDGVPVGGLTAHVFPMSRSKTPSCSSTISPSTPTTNVKASGNTPRRLNEAGAGSPDLDHVRTRAEPSSCAVSLKRGPSLSILNRARHPSSAGRR